MTSAPGPRFRLRAAFLVFALLASALPAGAQTGTGVVSGRVLDPAGAPVAGAAVRLLRAEGTPLRATTTDAAGAFRIAEVPAGRWRLRAERLGFAPSETEVRLGGGETRSVELRLRDGAVEVEGIEVRSTRDTQRERARFETEAGVTTRVITGRELKVLPGLAEADVLRSVEVLPGVVTTSDFSSAFHVRGGSADQNLVLLDGFPIFNPFHLGGLFGVFNSDVVARVELLAGGFGAEYGGRVSSVLNVETRDDAPPGVSGDAGVSLLASRVALRTALPGVLGGEGGMAFVSARRSYFDVVLPDPVRFPYHLTDLQGGVVMGTPGGGTLRLTGYTGRDVLDLSDFDPPGEDDDADNVLRVRWNWGNDVIGARWSQPFGGWVADTRLGFSRYAESLGFVDFADTRFSSRIEQVTARADVGRELSSRLGLRFGAEGNRLAYRNLSTAGGTDFYRSSDAGVLGAGYAQLRWRPDEAWIVEPGVRADVWRAQETTHSTFSPRLSVKRFLGADLDAAVKVSVGRYTQFLHSLRDESFPLSNDTWIVADANIPAVVSDQAQLGLEKYWGDAWYVSAEGYYRRFRGLTAVNFADDPNDATDDLLQGHGRSYGMDFMMRRTAGRLRGWAAVSFLRALQTLPDPLADGWTDLPPTLDYPPVYDRRVDVDLVLQYDLPWKVEAGARWNFGSGIPYTRPLGQYISWEYDVGSGEYRAGSPSQGDDVGPPFTVVLGPRNGERYPAYHRLDVSLRRTFQQRWGTATPYLQVLNLYNQTNPLFYFYNFDNSPATRSGISMFPTLPTLGVEVSF